VGLSTLLHTAATRNCQRLYHRHNRYISDVPLVVQK